MFLAKLFIVNVSGKKLKNLTDMNTKWQNNHPSISELSFMEDQYKRGNLDYLNALIYENFSSLEALRTFIFIETYPAYALFDEEFVNYLAQYYSIMKYAA